MAQTQIACPRCRQMIPAQVEQLFDVTSDPAAKQRLLSGQSNHARCPFCQFEGPLATPIVYHDNDKELLLTYFPSELGLPVNEQEKLVGPLITQLTNKLPAEKRKGYLLRPQTFLTMQSMVERILSADGITPEMLNEQQKRVQLLQRLLQATAPDVRAEIIKQEKNLIDETFFALMSRLFEQAMAQNQQGLAQALNAVQNQLLAETEYGQKLQGQVAEVEAAVKSLQDAGQGLTREKLLEIFLAAPSPERVKALTSLTRQGLDYQFFQMLTEKIDAASGDEKKKLEDLRAQILDITNEIDKQMEAQMKDAVQFVETLLAQPDIAQATRDNLNQFNEMVIQAINGMLREAQTKNDADKMNKLAQVVTVLQAASAPPELALLEELLSVEEKDIESVLEQRASEITPELMGLMGNLIQQLEQQPQEQLRPEDKETFEKVQTLYRIALRWQMKKNIA